MYIDLMMLDTQKYTHQDP